ncbi:MAG: aminoglycoside phosphotransferase family protein [Planctomycetota bacterium]
MRPVERQGHDNRTFRIGDELSARVPSHPAYVEHGVYEFECLPRIARGLSLPIPEPVARAEAGAEIEWPWLVLRWIAGETGSLEALADPVAFARDLAGFLGELHAISAGSGPAPGQHNFFRGGPLATYDADTRERIAALDEELGGARMTAAWERALASCWERDPVWVHGDLAIDNVLLNAGRLCAVIDFGLCAAGDPACDLVGAWTMFSGDSRLAFIETLTLDDATWARARGWALWKALFRVEEAGADGDSERRQFFLRHAEDILAE